MLVLGRGAEKAHRCELWMSRKMGLFGQRPPCKMPVCSCCRGARGSYVWHLLCALPLLSAVRPKPGYLSLFHMGVSSLLLPIVVLRPRVELERLLTAAGGVDPTQGKKEPPCGPCLSCGIVAAGGESSSVSKWFMKRSLKKHNHSQCFIFPNSRYPGISNNHNIFDH